MRLIGGVAMLLGAALAQDSKRCVRVVVGVVCVRCGVGDGSGWAGRDEMRG
jgi:hypothetical protein